MQAEFQMTNLEICQAIKEYFAARGLVAVDTGDIRLKATPCYGMGDRPTGTYDIQATVGVDVLPEFLKKTS